MFYLIMNSYQLKGYKKVVTFGRWTNIPVDTVSHFTLNCLSLNSFQSLPLPFPIHIFLLLLPCPPPSFVIPLTLFSSPSPSFPSSHPHSSSYCPSFPFFHLSCSFPPSSLLTSSSSSLSCLSCPFVTPFPFGLHCFFLSLLSLPPYFTLKPKSWSPEESH